MSTSALVTNKWGQTRVRISKCSYRWTISNFSYLQKKTEEPLESPYFNMDNLEAEWCLRLYLGGINVNFKDFLSLYLHRKPCSANSKFEGQYTLSLLDGENKRAVESSEHCQYNKNFSSCGFPNFAKIELLKELLGKDDSLQIQCDIAMVQGIESISSDDIKSTPSLLRSGHHPQSYLEKMFLDERFSDVRLVTPSGCELCAHKSVMAARSPIFAAMFEHHMRENQSNIVEIADVEYDVLKELLRFVYLERVENIEGMAAGLLAAADKYEIDGLREACAEVLAQILSVDNVIEILVLADWHSVENLKIRALNFAKAHIKVIIETQGFKTVTTPGVLRDLVRVIAE